MAEPCLHGRALIAYLMYMSPCIPRSCLASWAKLYDYFWQMDCKQKSQVSFPGCSINKLLPDALVLSPTQWPQKACAEILESKAYWLPASWKGVSLEDQGSCSGLFVSKLLMWKSLGSGSLLLQCNLASLWLMNSVPLILAWFPFPIFDP